MATTVTPPERKVSADEAREVAEAAREQEWAAPSFVRDLFLGRLRLDLVHPYPEQDAEEIRRAQPFLEKLERFLRGRSRGPRRATPRAPSPRSRSRSGASGPIPPRWRLWPRRARTGRRGS